MAVGVGVGVFVLLAVVAGIALAVHRRRRRSGGLWTAAKDDAGAGDHAGDGPHAPTSSDGDGSDLRVGAVTLGNANEVDSIITLMSHGANDSHLPAPGYYPYPHLTRHVYDIAAMTPRSAEGVSAPVSHRSSAGSMGINLAKPGCTLYMGLSAGALHTPGGMNPVYEPDLTGSNGAWASPPWGRSLGASQTHHSRSTTDLHHAGGHQSPVGVVGPPRSTGCSPVGSPFPGGFGHNPTPFSAGVRLSMDSNGVMQPMVDRGAGGPFGAGTPTPSRLASRPLTPRASGTPGPSSATSIYSGTEVEPASAFGFRSKPSPVQPPTVDLAPPDLGLQVQDNKVTPRMGPPSAFKDTPADTAALAPAAGDAAAGSGGAESADDCGNALFAAYQNLAHSILLIDADAVPSSLAPGQSPGLASDLASAMPLRRDVDDAMQYEDIEFEASANGGLLGVGAVGSVYRARYRVSPCILCIACCCH